MRPASVQELAQWYPARKAQAKASRRKPLPTEALAALEPARHATAADASHAANAWWQIDSIDALRQLLQRRAPGQPLATPSRAKLGEILLERGLVQQEQIDRALEMQRAAASTARPLLGQLLIRLGAVAEEDTIRALCVQEGVPLVDLDRLEAHADARSKIPLELARQHRAVPVMRVGKLLAVAVDNPLAFPSKDFLSFYTNLAVELVYASRASIAWRLEHYDAGRSAAQLDQEFKSMAHQAMRQAPASARRAAPAPVQPTVQAEDATVIQLVNKMVTDALSPEDFRHPPGIARAERAFAASASAATAGWSATRSSRPVPRRGDRAPEDHGRPRHRRAAQARRTARSTSRASPAAG